jgi:hypothetical protein
MLCRCTLHTKGDEATMLRLIMTGNLHRKQRDVRSMQQASARRERSLQHVPQAQQQRGSCQKEIYNRGAGWSTEPRRQPTNGTQDHENYSALSMG